MHQVPLQGFEVFPTTFGRYRVVKLLGQGGMGAVYLAQDTQLDRPVALKIPTFSGNDGPMVLERFQREARAAATILHPNVCPLYDVGEIDGVPYLTMGYIDGKPLAAYVAARPQPPRQSAFLVRKLALALAEAHKRGVIHRDLKPANVMIDKRSEPIIMDFGLARRARSGDARLTQMGSMMGTPAYMPPEQVSGDVNLMGPACDIYSLGVILYELLAGRLPFSGDAMAMLSQVLLDDPPPPSKFRPELDPELEAICLKAMAKKIPDRHASMTELAAALQDYLRGKPPATEPAAAPRNASRATLVPGTRAADLVEAEAETLRPEKNVRAPDTMPVVAPIADSPPTSRTFRKTRRPRRKSRRRGGVPLWLWIAVGGAAALVLVVLLVVLSRRGHGTQLAAAPTGPTDKTPAKPISKGVLKEERPAGDPVRQVTAPPAKPELLHAIPWEDAEQRIHAHVFHTGISADGKLFFGAGDAGPTGSIRIFEVASGKQVHDLRPGGNVWFSSAAFVPGGQYLVAAYSQAKDLYLWDIATGKVVRKFTGHTGRGNGFAVSPDGKWLVSWGDDHTLCLWDVATGKLQFPPHYEANAPVPSVFSPDGKTILSFYPSFLEVWKAEMPGTHTLLRSDPKGGSHSGCFSPDGAQILWFASDRTIRLLDRSTQRTKDIRRFAGGRVKEGGGFIADGRQVAAYCEDRTYHVWDTASGQIVRVLDLSDAGEEGKFITPSPDGRMALLGHPDKSVRVYDLAAGKEVHRYNGCPNAKAFSFTPDGQFAVAGSFRAGLYVFRLPSVGPGKP